MLRYSRRTPQLVLYLPCQHKRTQLLPHKQPLMVGTGGSMMPILSLVLRLLLDALIQIHGMQRAYRSLPQSVRALLFNVGSPSRYPLLPRCDFICFLLLYNFGLFFFFLVFHTNYFVVI